MQTTPDGLGVKQLYFDGRDGTLFQAAACSGCGGAVGTLPMIDRKGILRLRVTHDFVDRDLETLRMTVGLTDIQRANAESDHEAAMSKAEYVPV